jgi:hypothetical protein
MKLKITIFTIVIFAVNRNSNIIRSIRNNRVFIKFLAFINFLYRIVNRETATKTRKMNNIVYHKV